MQTWRSWVYTCAAVVGFLVLWWVADRYLLAYIGPFVGGAIVGELLHPLVTRMARWPRVSRGIAVSLLLVVTLAVVGLGITWASIAAVGQVSRVAQSIPDVYAQGLALEQQLAARLPTRLPDSLQGVLAQAPTAVKGWLLSNTGNAWHALASLALVPKRAVDILIALTAAFFFCRDRDEVQRFMLSLLPEAARPKVKAAIKQMWASVLAFVGAQLLIALFTAVLCAVGLLVVRADNALVMALLIGIFGMIPVVGMGVVFLPWIGYQALFGDSTMAIKLLVIFGIVTVVRQIFEPKIVGERVGLHPLLILVSLYVGIEVFGATGVFIGPVLALAVRALFQSGLLPVRTQPHS